MEKQMNYQKKEHEMLEPKPGFLIVKIVETEEALNAMKKPRIIAPGSATRSPVEALFRVMGDEKLNDHPFLVKVYFSSDKENIPNGTIAAMGARNWGLLKDSVDNKNFVNFDAIVCEGSLYWIIQIDWIVALMPSYNDRIIKSKEKGLVLTKK